MRALPSLALALLATAAAAQGAPGSAASPAGPLLPRDSADAAAFRGSLVFNNYCVTCHGIHGDGNGRAARLYNPRPANLRSSDKNDAYMLMIIRMGGRALARSEFMPPWGGELTEEQMRDVTAYLRSPAEGLWRDAATHAVRDEIVIYEVMSEELDRPWWAAYRGELPARFRQELLIVRVSEIELL